MQRRRVWLEARARGRVSVHRFMMPLLLPCPCCRAHDLPSAWAISEESCRTTIVIVVRRWDLCVLGKTYALNGWTRERPTWPRRWPIIKHCSLLLLIILLLARIVSFGAVAAAGFFAVLRLGCFGISIESHGLPSVAAAAHSGAVLRAMRASGAALPGLRWRDNGGDDERINR